MPQEPGSHAGSLVQRDDGTIVVAGTRVPIDTVVIAFENGATAEEIAQQYPSVSLGVVYEVIGYYLQHRTELRGYLDRREILGKTIRIENELRSPAEGIRARLLARRK